MAATPGNKVGEAYVEVVAKDNTGPGLSHAKAQTDKFVADQKAKMRGGLGGGAVAPPAASTGASGSDDGEPAVGAFRALSNAAKFLRKALGGFVLLGVADLFANIARGAATASRAFTDFAVNAETKTQDLSKAYSKLVRTITGDTEDELKQFQAMAAEQINALGDALSKLEADKANQSIIGKAAASAGARFLGFDTIDDAIAAVKDAQERIASQSTRYSAGIRAKMEERDEKRRQALAADSAEKIEAIRVEAVRSQMTEEERIRADAEENIRRVLKATQAIESAEAVRAIEEINKARDKALDDYTKRAIDAQVKIAEATANAINSGLARIAEQQRATSSADIQRMTAGIESLVTLAQMQARITPRLAG